MPIPAEHADRYVYHFTHIDNLPGLLRHGFLANNNPKFPKRHRSIASDGIQGRRARTKVSCGPGGCVHDYVPFYFGSVSPMLLGVINAKNVDQFDILYFEFPISLVLRADTIFSGASANTAVMPDFYDDAADLAQLDWNAIDSKKWSSPDDAHRHRRMAELLVHNQLPLTAAARCIVWNEAAKRRVEAIVGETPFPPIAYQDKWTRPHWFLNFARGGTSSLVKGPREIAANYEAACAEVEKHAGDNQETAEFKNLKHLLAGLRADFGCLPHTAELVELRSENGVHRRTVDVHTKDVVAGLIQLEEYRDLNEKQRMLVEIAAYLHDIGKGPRSRWANNGGLQKVDPDHPVNAMPMMTEILTRHVGTVSASSARTLLKLVCYHDLVGDVLGRDRDENQIHDVANDTDELKMLFAIAQADINALKPHWWNKNNADALYGRCVEAIERSGEE